MVSIDFLKGRSRSFIILLSLLLTLCLGWVDRITGFEISFSVFYLFPIAIAAWYGGRNPGIAIAVLSTVTWTLADWLAGRSFSHPAISAWNIVARFAFFLVVSLLVSRVYEVLSRERSMARTDYLTGALNVRAFYESMNAEQARSRRYGHVYTLAYLDLDNFKHINDTFGHSTGDELLRIVVECVRGCLRVSDSVARLGGDEFALLLPETDEAQAVKAMEKVREAVAAEMRERQWPVTLSMGVLTCSNPPCSVDDLLKQVDKLMYSVKTSGKNSVRHACLEGPEIGAPLKTGSLKA